MFLQALRVAFGLMLFKGGPQDMPFALPVTRASVAAAVVSSALVVATVAPLPMALATGVGGAAGVAFFTLRMLRSRKLDNRFQQTLSAQLLMGSLFALLMWPAVMAMAPAMQEMMATMRAGLAAAESGAAAPSAFEIGAKLNNPPPVWASLWTDVLFIWSLVAGTRVNRLAAEVSRPSSWLLTLLSLLVLTGFVFLAQIVVSIFVG